MNRNSKSIIAVIAVAATAQGFGAAAQSYTDVNVTRDGSLLRVDFRLDTRDMDFGSNREVTLMPIVSDGTSRAELPAVIVAGRNRYIQNERHDIPAPGSGISMIRKGESLAYSVTTPWQEWMERSALYVDADECNCGFSHTDLPDTQLATLDFAPREFVAEYVFVTPAAEAVKTRDLAGSAFIDFPVNKTTLLPDYRRNPQELAKIRSTIDAVKNDADSHITGVTICGYASPEGSYEANERLAAGRAATLADYVSSLYTFPKSMMHTSSVAEDWAGLRKWVEDSDIANRDAILAIIDSPDYTTPDAREWKLKSTYPEQYKYLLANVYPSLRHSDYTVDYTVRSFTDPAEIACVFAESPQKLSLAEMYVLAGTLKPGSDEYNRVFEVAASMYPDAPEANLNMANIALGRNELDRAAKYLERAADSPAKTYTQGLLLARRGDYTAALPLIEAASQAGLAEATAALDSLREVIAWQQR